MNSKDLRGVRLWLAAFLVLFTWLPGAAPVQGGDKLEHYDLVFTMARAAGYGVAESRVIASASWSVDLNLDTTAFDQNRDIRGIINHEWKNFSNFWEDPDKFTRDQIWMPDGNFRYAAQGIALHALGHPEARQAMDKYLRDQIDQAKDPNARLVLTGMYLHFLVDSKVHPQEPTVGHAFEGHGPDYVFTQPMEYTKAGKAVLEFLVDRKPQLLDKEKQGNVLTSLTDAKGALDPKKAEEFSSKVVQSISSAYHDEGLDKPSLKNTVENYLGLTAKQKEDLDIRVHRNLEQNLRTDFQNIPKGFTVVPFTKPVSYQRDEKLNLQIRADWIPTGPGSSWNGVAITDPVYALNTHKELKPVRDQLIGDVGQWVHSHGLLAVGLPLLSPSDASKFVTLEKQLGSAGVEMTRDAASAIQQRAQNACQKVATNAVVFQHQAEARGVEAMVRMQDGAFRVVHIVKDGLKVYDGVTEGVGRVYTLDMKASKALADKMGGVKLETALKVHAALGRPTPDRRVLLRDDGSVLVSNKNGPFEMVHFHWAEPDRQFRIVAKHYQDILTRLTARVRVKADTTSGNVEPLLRRYDSIITMGPGADRNRLAALYEKDRAAALDIHSHLDAAVAQLESKVILAAEVLLANEKFRQLPAMKEPPDGKALDSEVAWKDLDNKVRDAELIVAKARMIPKAPALALTDLPAAPVESVRHKMLPYLKSLEIGVANTLRVEVRSNYRFTNQTVKIEVFVETGPGRASATIEGNTSQTVTLTPQQSRVLTWQFTPTGDGTLRIGARIVK